MLSAIEHLMSFHPAYRFGRLERPHSDIEAFEELERTHQPGERGYGVERIDVPWRLADVAVTVMIVLAFCGLLTAIARSPGQPPGTAERPIVEASDVNEPR